MLAGFCLPSVVGAASVVMGMGNISRLRGVSGVEALVSARLVCGHELCRLRSVLRFVVEMADDVVDRATMGWHK
jgi:hypothetical protein